MKISCDIIRDLLPLYAENMTSQASNEMVDEHLQECQGCKGYLEALRTPTRLPEQLPVQNLNHIKKEIDKRRIMAVLTAVFFVLSLVAGVRAFLNAEIILTVDQAVDYVETLEDGSVRVHWNYRDRGYSANKDDGDPGNWGILVTQRRSELLFGKDAATPENRAKNPGAYYTDYGIRDNVHSVEDNYWYVNLKDGTGEQLLRNGGAEMPPEGYLLSKGINYSLGWLCAGTGVLTVLLGFAAWLLRGRRTGKWIRYVAMFFGCFCVSVFLASGGQFVAHHGEDSWRFKDSWWLVIPMFVTGLCVFKLYDLKKKDTP